MSIFIYAVMAGRKSMRNGEIAYFIKYIISFIALTIFGAESTKFFAQTHLWYLCYVISVCFLFYGILRLIVLNYKNH